VEASMPWTECSKVFVSMFCFVFVVLFLISYVYMLFLSVCVCVYCSKELQKKPKRVGILSLSKRRANCAETPPDINVDLINVGYKCRCNFNFNLKLQIQFEIEIGLDLHLYSFYAFVSI
jgi:hypothetical protein